MGNTDKIDLLSPTPLKERVRQIPIHKSTERKMEAVASVQITGN